MKNKKRHGGFTGGFGGYHGKPHDRSVGVYIALVVIAVLISVSLVVFLIVRKQEPTPVKVAYFPPEPVKPGLMEKGGAVDSIKKIFLSHSKTQTGIGAAKMLTGQKTEAIKNFDKVIEANPVDPAGYLQRGAAYLANGEIDLGTKDIEKAAELDPKYEKIASKCETIQKLFKNANFQVSPEQIKQMMAKLTPEDVQRINKQAMTPEEESGVERNIFGNDSNRKGNR